MTTIVTPATVSAVADASHSLTIALIVTTLLVLVVIANEVSFGTRADQRVVGGSPILNIPMFPLFIVFVLIFATRVLDALT